MASLGSICRYSCYGYYRVAGAAIRVAGGAAIGITCGTVVGIASGISGGFCGAYCGA
jgi:hypothetical protein